MDTVEKIVVSPIAVVISRTISSIEARNGAEILRDVADHLEAKAELNEFIELTEGKLEGEEE
jgi:hypothetical protein